MLTILENARIVISLLKKHNIRYIVLSPGGSNIPIVQGVQQDPFFKCYSVVDERSAMYFAIGLYLKTGEIIATSCTSAQATRNYVPGLTEAFYKHVPVLAITMSKHPRYLLQDYMQCPIQTSLPVDAVKASYSLPYINNDNDRAQCIRTANEAMLELTHNGNGPVQLNIEELDNETWQFSNDLELPDVRCIKRYVNVDVANDLKNKKILIVIGEHRVFSDSEKSAIEKFCDHHDVVIYSDHISNYHGAYALNANLRAMIMSQDAFDTQYSPDILITFGGLTGDYGIFNLLLRSKISEHWRIDVDGKVVDTYNKLTRIYQMEVDDFFNGVKTSNYSFEHSYYNRWKQLVDNSNHNVEVPFSNLYAAQQLHYRIPANSTMCFAILNSLRVWSYFPLHESIDCYSNVAAFGIDGCLSTMIGTSVVSDKLTFLITGDLSFFYDMNALGIRHIKNNLRVLLVNNNGGAEFKMGNLETKTDVSSFISAAGHFKTAKGWSETNGLKYLCAKNKDEFLAVVDEFLEGSEKPILLEIFTEASNERKANGLIRTANFEGTKAENVKNSIKKVLKQTLGADTIDKLKHKLS